MRHSSLEAPRSSFGLETLETRRLLSSAPPFTGGTDNDIVYASDGTIHVAWYNKQAGSLHYSSRSAGGAWAAAVTIDSIPDLPAGTSGVGEYVSLALDSQNRPAVAYSDAYNGDLKFASRATGAWVVGPNIENTAGLYPSLLFNGADAPLISYYFKNTRDLKLARWTGSGWNRQTLDATDDVGRSSSMHMIPGSADRVAIAYERTTGGDFKYAEVTPAGAWSFAVVDTEPVGGGGFTSLDFDSNNNPAFSYYDSWTSTLKYASRSGSTWTPTGISGRISHWSNLWFNPTDGSGHLIYYDKLGNLINHLTKTLTSGWSGPNPEMRLGGGNYVSAAFKNDGTIAYTYGSPYSATEDKLGVGVLAGNLVQQPALATTPTVVSASRIDLAWTYPSGGPQSGFTIGISTDGGFTFPEERVVASASARSAQITGLNGDTTYTFNVRAHNGTGDSTFSNKASATTPVAPPVAPTGLAASAASSSAIDLLWNDLADETVYKIERSLTGTSGWTQIVQLDANLVSYTDTGLSAGTHYHYRIRAANAGGESPYATFSPVSTSAAAPAPQTAPAGPANFTATAQSSSRVNLSWSAVTGATGYVLQRLDGTAYISVATLAAGATSYSAGGLTDQTAYTFRIHSTADTGNSATVTAGATTPARITVESTATPPAQLNDLGAAAGAGFGRTIATQGNLILSGNLDLNNGIGGAVLIDAGTGSVLRRFANPGVVPDEFDWFGASVALVGDRIAISAPDGDMLDASRVYIYDDYEDDVPDLVLQYPVADYSGFGNNLAAIGDDLLVQAPSVNGGDPGEVWRYDLTTGQVIATYVATSANSQLGDRMAVDAAANTVLLTARVTGGMKVIEYNATTGAVLREFAVSGANDLSVAYSPTGIFIGDSYGNAVHQYDRASTSAVPVPVYTYSTADSIRFGSRLAISGNQLLVTAPAEQRVVSEGYVATGAAYVYDTATHALVQHIIDPTPDLWSGNYGQADRFASTVGVLGGGQFVLGNSTDDALGLIDVGSVHVFDV